MAVTIAFDIYETLIDTSGVSDALEQMIGDQSKKFINHWRQKQLEYTFRRGLMESYVPFSVCTLQALKYTSAALQIPLSEEQQNILMSSYKVLPVFPDVVEAFELLQDTNCRKFAFSNGHLKDLEQLLLMNGIIHWFEKLVSCQAVNSFKPNPKVYHYFFEETDSKPEDTWMISGNPFDVIGAINAGMKAVWVKRKNLATFDPWEFKPTATIHSLTELKSVLNL